MKSLLINPSFPFPFVKYLLLEDKLAMTFLLASVTSLNCYYHVITVVMWVRKRLDVTSFPVVHVIRPPLEGITGSDQET